MATSEEVAEHYRAFQIQSGIVAPPNTPAKRKYAEDEWSEDVEIIEPPKCPDAPRKAIAIEIALHQVNISNYYYDKKQGNWQQKRSKLFITSHELDNIKRQINK